jgi:hypothetical protein
MIKNGDKIPQEQKDRILLAISLDNREDLLCMDRRLKQIEEHPFHKMTPKRIAAFLSAFLSLTLIYIKESRDAILDGLQSIVVALFGS